MRLYLMRHGIAISPEDPDCPPEPERYLTPKGIEKTRAAAHGLHTLKPNPDLILSSPYLRAVQTAELACVALELPIGDIRRTEALLPGASPILIFEELAKSKTEEAICFGHAPNLDEIIAYALHSPKPCTELKKAGAACLDLDSLSPVDGHLVWLLTSRALRALAD